MSEKMSKTKPAIPDLCGELLASLKVPRLEDENAALTKRVAELEFELRARTMAELRKDISVLKEHDASHVAKLEAETRVLRAIVADISSEHDVGKLLEHIADLQSQLAWTPVAQWLPTEPGEGETYEFTDGSRVNILTLNGEIWEDEEDVADDYKWFRRITLPEAT
jgi:hypothetical protein